MGRLPVISGRVAVKAFTRLGWRLMRQTGSHMILVKDGSMVSLSVPDHREVAKGTLRALVSQAGLTVEEFAEACR